MVEIAVAASVALLAIGVYIAQGRGDPTYTIDQVRSAFAAQGYSLAAPTGGEFGERAEGTFVSAAGPRTAVLRVRRSQ